MKIFTFFVILVSFYLPQYFLNLHPETAGVTENVKHSFVPFITAFYLTICTTIISSLFYESRIVKGFNHKKFAYSLSASSPSIPVSYVFMARLLMEMIIQISK